jgi:hypothetical protein
VLDRSLQRPAAIRGTLPPFVTPHAGDSVVAIATLDCLLHPGSFHDPRRQLSTSCQTEHGLRRTQPRRNLTFDPTEEVSYDRGTAAGALFGAASRRQIKFRVAVGPGPFRPGAGVSALSSIEAALD